MIKVKLCGLRRISDAEAASEIKPDYAGFVFAPKRRRYISPVEALQLKQNLHPSIKACGVFVNEDPELIREIAGKGIIDIIQLHGEEDEAYIRALRRITNLPLIKAFSVTDAGDIKTACCSSADMILLDAGKGGSGSSFDRALLNGIKRPYFLAGGLDPDNVASVLISLKDAGIPLPYAVDVSSGTETDGQKDNYKMRAFTENVRALCL